MASTSTPLETLRPESIRVGWRGAPLRPYRKRGRGSRARRRARRVEERCVLTRCAHAAVVAAAAAAADEVAALRAEVFELKSVVSNVVEDNSVLTVNLQRLRGEFDRLHLDLLSSNFRRTRATPASTPFAYVAPLVMDEWRRSRTARVRPGDALAPTTTLIPAQVRPVHEERETDRDLLHAPALATPPVPPDRPPTSPTPGHVT